MFFRRRAPTPTELRTPTDAAAADNGAAGEIDRLLAKADAAPKDVTNLADLVGLLGKAKRDEEAAFHAAKLLELRPGHRRALRVLTRAPRADVDIIGGWRVYALTAPDDVEPWLQIARLAARADDRRTSLDACEEALGRDPRHAEVLTLKIAALQALHRHDVAGSAWGLLREVDPERAEAVLARATDAGDSESAIAMLGAARSKGPLGAAMGHEALRLRSRLTVDAYAAEVAGRHAAAAEAFARLSRLEPDETDHADGLRRALAPQRDPVAGDEVGADRADTAATPVRSDSAALGDPAAVADRTEPEALDLMADFDESAGLG